MSPANPPPTSATFYLVQDDADDPHASHASPTPLGFWIYLMSDALIFATLFATYGVLATAYAGGPTPADLFDLRLVGLNTGLLLVSSITFGMAMLAMPARRVSMVQGWLVATGLLGAGFLGVELYEFAHLFSLGATPQRSAFWSAFYTLVGTHGLHVLFGLIWIMVMLVQIGQRGLTEDNQRRLLCLGMFWHLLDIVWIGVFSFVYLLGVLQ